MSVVDSAQAESGATLYVLDRGKLRAEDRFWSVCIQHRQGRNNHLSLPVMPPVPILRSSNRVRESPFAPRTNVLSLNERQH
jgi:hypothetical protein